jgi:hypothetical protein
MRSDMAKILVERPRLGGGSRFPRGRNPDGPRVPCEDWRTAEGMRRPWLRGDYKSLNENLAPLRRYLRSNVGRPWDKVYSEVCQRINRDSAVQFHVWQHLMTDVCTNPYLIEGDVGRGPWTWFRFYVDPKTGLLRENRVPPEWKRKRKRTRRRHAIPIDDTHEYRQLEGIWYELTLAPIPAGEEPFDIVLKVRVSEANTEARSFYGRPVYCPPGGKRQLNSREIRRLPVEEMR